MKYLILTLFLILATGCGKKNDPAANPLFSLWKNDALTLDLSKGASSKNGVFYVNFTFADSLNCSAVALMDGSKMAVTESSPTNGVAQQDFTDCMSFDGNWTLDMSANSLKACQGAGPDNCVSLTK